ncbi:MAG TPA: hypothetical protein VER32_14440 [Pyrinomonadaceae bacterium]|nr:hypothetical protein [Pyrinomonadaceae bacterium]
MKLASLLLLACLAAQATPPRVTDSVLGVGVGTTIEEAHARLKDLGTVGGRATRDGGRKEAWTLKETDFTSVAYKTDAKGRVQWVTGFVREGREIPFEKLGDPARAVASGDTEIAWSVERPEGDYRLVAKGPNRRARVVYLLSLATKD